MLFYILIRPPSWKHVFLFPKYEATFNIIGEVWLTTDCRFSKPARKTTLECTPFEICCSWPPALYRPLLVLLTLLLDHSTQSTNTFANFDHLIAPIIMVQLAKLQHQYIGGALLVAPICEANILRILRVCWFFICLQHHYIGARWL